MIAILGATLPILFGLRDWYFGAPTILMSYATGCAIFSVAVFGREFSSDSMTLLLSQPVSRRSMWKRKLTVAIPVCAISACVFIAFSLRFDAFYKSSSIVSIFCLPWMISFGYLGIGIFAVLWLKQVISSFWLVLMSAPFVLLIARMLDWVTGTTIEQSQIAALGIACALCAYTAAWKRFCSFEEDGHRMKDVVIRLKREKTNAKNTSDILPGTPVRVLHTLVRKELQLHQVTFIVAGLMTAFFFVLYFLPIDHRNRQQVDMIQMLTIISRYFWLLLPIIIGATAFAEENRMGVIDWTHTMPISRRFQFFMKTAVCLGLSLLLPGFLAFLLDWIAMNHPEVRIRYPVHLGEIALRGEIGLGNIQLIPVILYLVSPASLVILGMYASSLSRSFSQALGYIAGIVFFLFAAFGIGHSLLGYVPPLESFIWLVIIGIPAFTLAFLFLCYRNYKTSMSDQNFWKWNWIAVPSTALAIILVSGLIYYRMWEPFTLKSSKKVDPNHAMKVEPKIGRDGRFIISPDGSLWRMDLNRIENKSDHPIFIQIGNDTDWTQLAPDPWNYTAMYGHKQDGSIWHFASPRRKNGPETISTRFGTDQDWVKIESGKKHVLAIKENGSLWGWGDNSFLKLNFRVSEKLEGELNLNNPVLLDDQSKWKDIATMHGVLSFGLKEDGTLWGWDGRDEITSGSEMRQKVTQGSVLQSLIPTPFIQSNNQRGAIQIHPDNDWTRIHGSTSSSILVARKADGSRWIWYHHGRIPWTLGPTHLMTHEMPVHISQNDLKTFGGDDFGNRFAITTDGSLCMWQQAVFQGNNRLLRKLHGSDFNEAPILIDHGKAWAACYVSHNWALAITRDGGLWQFGRPLNLNNASILLPHRFRPKRIATLQAK